MKNKVSLLERSLDPKSKESNKRLIASILVFFLMLVALILLLPYEIKPINADIIKTIIASFAVIITSAFVMNGIENVKQIKADKDVNITNIEFEQEVH